MPGGAKYFSDRLAAMFRNSVVGVWKDTASGASGPS